MVTTTGANVMGFNKYMSYLVSLCIIFFAANANASIAYDKESVQQIIVTEANRQGVDPVLALAIASVESNFNALALSHAGAKGVMQIMPATAEKEFGISASRLYDAKVNVRIGIAFIKQLLHTYKQRIDIALSHYNGGSRVKNKYGRLRVMPSTKNYVNKVLAARYQYEDIAGELTHNQDDQRKYKAAQQSLSYGAAISESSEITQNVRSPGEYSLTLAQPDAAQQDPRISQLQQLRMHNVMRNNKQQLEVVQSTEKNLPAKSTNERVTQTPIAQFIVQQQATKAVNKAKVKHLMIRGPKAAQVSTATNRQVVYAYSAELNDGGNEQADSAAFYQTRSMVRPAIVQVARRASTNNNSRVIESSSLSEKQKKVLEWESIFN
jgi:hypothetical protein